MSPRPSASGHPFEWVPGLPPPHVPLGNVEGRTVIPVEVGLKKGICLGNREADVVDVIDLDVELPS